MNEHIYRCPCRDTGVQMMTEGEFDVGHEYRHQKVLATPEHPVFVRCQRCNPKQAESDRKRRTGTYS